MDPEDWGELIQEQHGVDFDVRVGINTGLVVVGAVGSDLRMEYTALGDSDGDWYATTTLSYEANQAYGMFQRLLRRMMGIAFEAQPSEIEERLASMVEILPEARRPRARQVLEALFGIEAGEDDLPMEGETFKRELLEAIQDWWRASFSARPKVIVFDDMHWSDAASIELLTQLMPLIEAVPREIPPKNARL